MLNDDKKYQKIRSVNKKFYDLPPKEREIIEQSCAGYAFDMKRPGHEALPGQENKTQ